MNKSPRHSGSHDENFPPVGLTAFGRAGDWEVSINETTSGAVKWFAQVEGPSVYLCFEVASPSVIEEWIQFFNSPEGLSVGKRRKIEVGAFNDTPVTLRRDNEYPDRYFFCVGEEGRETLRITVAGDDFKGLSAAVRKVREELKSRG